MHSPILRSKKRFSVNACGSLPAGGRWDAVRYKVVEDERVQRKARSLFVRDRVRYLDIKKTLQESPYPTVGDRISRLDFDDGLSIYACITPAFRFTVVYSIREPDPGETQGSVRIIALIDRDAERSAH